MAGPLRSRFPACVSARLARPVTHAAYWPISMAFAWAGSGRGVGCLVQRAWRTRGGVRGRLCRWRGHLLVFRRNCVHGVCTCVREKLIMHDARTHTHTHTVLIGYMHVCTSDDTGLTIHNTGIFPRQPLPRKRRNALHQWRGLCACVRVYLYVRVRSDVLFLPPSVPASLVLTLPLLLSPSLCPPPAAHLLQVYVGKFKHGKRHGRGVLRYPIDSSLGSLRFRV